MGKSPWALLTGLGAMTAIILLVFKDSILGFVASIQIATNDLVRVGDWISMERYGADDVIDIGLHAARAELGRDRLRHPDQGVHVRLLQELAWHDGVGRPPHQARAVHRHGGACASSTSIARLTKLEVLSESIAGRARRVTS